MEQVKQAKPTPKMRFKNQKKFSEKVHERMLKAIEEISEYCDKFEIKNEQNETFLFNRANHYYWDLANGIFNLQQILIDIGKNIPSADKLESVLRELNKITSSIQESLKLNPKNLVANLKANIVCVGFQVENLTKIIELDDSHQYKQRILDYQLDLVIYTEKLKFGMQFCNLSHAEIMKCLHNLVDTLISTFIGLKSGQLIVEADFVHYIRRNLQHIQYVVDYMVQLRNTERFPKSLNEAFQNVEKISETFMDEALHALESDYPIQEFIIFIEKCHTSATAGSDVLQKGLSAIQDNVDKKVGKLIQDIILYLYIFGLNFIYSLNKTVEDIIIQN